jgi:hypothetical protein
MYCPSCGNELSVELKYCNRCGANLSQGLSVIQGAPPAPVKLTGPSIVVGLMVICGVGIIFSSAARFAEIGIHPFALAWMILFGMATLFGCTALLIRFWSRIISLQHEKTQHEIRGPQPTFVPPRGAQPQQLPPRMEPVPSVTEHTTRTFSYKEKSEH